MPPTQEARSRKAALRIAGWLGLLTALLGAVVLAGWLTGSPRLVQVAPSYVSMRPNSAFGFLAAGLALLAAAGGWRRAVAPLAGLTLLDGLATVAQYVLVVTLPWDRLAVPGGPNSDGPVRMALSTAACFLLTGTALLLSAWGDATRRPGMVIGLFGALMLMIAVVCLGGYAIGMPQLYGWGHYTRMAVHTAGGFLALGAGMVALAAGGRRQARPDADALRHTILVSAVLGVTITALFGSLLAVTPMSAELQRTQASRLREQVRLKAEALGMATAQAASLAGSVGSRLRARDLLAAWARGEISREECAAGTAAILGEALRGTPDLVGAARYARDGQRLCAVGLDGGEPAPDDAMRIRPALIAGDPCLVVQTPVRDPGGGVLATDVIVVAIRRLLPVLAFGIDTEAGGELRLVAPGAAGDLVWTRSGQALDDRAPLPKTVADALAGGGGLVDSGELATMHAYAPVPGQRWTLVASIDKSTAHAGIDRQLPLVISLIAAFAACGGVAIWLLVRPLAGLMVRRDEDLRREVAEQAAALERESAKQALVSGALAASEGKLRSLIESARVGIVIADASGRVVSWNPGAQAQFGWPAGEILGRDLTMLMPERFHAAHRAGLARVAAGGASRVIGRTVELVGRRRDGSEFPIELSLAAWVSEGERFFSGIIADITDRKRVEAELRAAKEAAESASRAKGEFLATMSHEIRTPMNGIVGMTALLADTALDQRQRAMIASVRGCADGLLGIIDDILDFSKIEAGRLDLDEVEFDLAGEVEEAVGLLAERAHAKGLALIVDIAPEAPATVRGDPGRLRQVLLNLVGNAVKFSERGEVCVRIEPAGAADGGRERIAGLVRDTGIGIPAQHRERLFQPFSQLDGSAARRHGGTGLGLAICQRLVALMGGSIELVESSPAGSVFRFTVPLGVVAGPRPPPPGLAGVRALVVDGNAASRAMVQRRLAAWGMDCATAGDGAVALDLLRAAVPPIRLVVADLRLPALDGAALAAAIAADQRLRGTALILLAALSEAGAVRVAGMTGSIACLVKPVRQAQLRAALATALSGAPPPPAPVATPAPPRLRGRVLIAEDNAVNQQIAHAQLESLGVAADIAENGVVALAALAAGGYDAVLMDCQMPELDGYDATRELRRREQAAGGRRLPVIAMTANAMVGDRERCLAAGMDDYLAKPVRTADLAAALARWLPVTPGAAPTAAARPPTPVPPPPARRPCSLPELFDPGAIAIVRSEAGSAVADGLLPLYAEEAPRLAQRLAAAVAAGDGAGVRHAAHSLKSISQTVGALRLAETSRGIEERARSGELPTADEVTALRALLDATLGAITA